MVALPGFLGGFLPFQCEQSGAGSADAGGFSKLDLTDFQELKQPHMPTLTKLAVQAVPVPYMGVGVGHTYSYDKVSQIGKDTWPTSELYIGTVSFAMNRLVTLVKKGMRRRRGGSAEVAVVGDPISPFPPIIPHSQPFPTIPLIFPHVSPVSPHLGNSKLFGFSTHVTQLERTWDGLAHVLSSLNMALPGTLQI